MASNSPSPSVVPSPTNSTPTPSLPPPPSISSASPSPPPSSSFSPPPLPTQPNANPPVTSTTPAPSSPPSQSDTSTTPTPSSPPSLSPPPSAPPPSQSRSPPPMASTSPTASPQPPSSSSGPPPSQPASPPPTPSSIPPTSPPSPPASSPPPTNSPPPVNPPPPSPPQSSSPPPASSSPPPQNSPPPVQNSPPPASSVPPQNSPPPSPSSVPPANSPPPATPADPPTNSSSPSPPSVQPPRSSPPPRSTQPGNSPPPTPPIAPPRNSSTPPTMTPPSQPTPPSPTTPGISPPSPVIRFAPPPPSSTDPAAPESSISPDNQGIGTGAIIAIAAVVGIVVLSLLGLAVWCVKKRRKDTSGLNVGYVMPSPLGYPSGSDLTAIKVHSTAPLIVSGSSSDFVYTPTEGGGLGNSRSWFTYEELVKATNGFSAMNLLGEGGFGSVYKGFLPDERVVAVKRLNIGGGQGEREFKAEVEIISRIHHRHLVSLVGYCISEDRRLLVYDYVPNNSLHFHLHGEGRPVLNWAMRVKIAAGAARGIAYLHEDCHPRIIHRDIKSSNILLDDNFEAKVSDFGLAKLALDANTHVTTRVMGTFGYMAPEYASSGKLTEKSDVFSYGVVLLELITGRKPVDASQPLGDESLVEWARPLLSHALENGEFGGLADPRLEKNYDENEMFRMIEAAAACVRHSAAKRPRMGQVVRAFDSLATADLTNGMRLGESEVYNAADQSAQIRWFRRMAFGSQNYSTDFFSQGSSSS